MRIATLGLILLGIATGAAQASEGRAWRTRVVESPLEARGCYWHRQHQYCGRYCYTENDGRRFCRVRSDEAVPQTSQEEVILDERPPLK
jgi:hypothetical protein